MSGDVPDGSTDCVVVGGGPGGMLLAYLLARGGVRVTLLEAHQDFDRDFRGDSLHPYTLELLDELGLADDLLRLPHFAAARFRMHTPAGMIVAADYGRLPGRYPFIALMPQVRFLDYLAEQAGRLPDFRLQFGARVRRLVTDESGAVTGVGWRGTDGEHELSARVVVAVDGRFSKLRNLAEMPLTSLDAASDLLWFRLPRRAEDPPEADVDLYFGRRHYVGLLGGTEDWQIGYSLPKGGYAAAREAGVAPIRSFLDRHLPWIADRSALLTDFGQTTLLSVEIARLEHWYKPGLLVLGDAAHVISPVGGNGILMAVQDAVAAANRLIPALRLGADRVPETVLAAIQADREPAIRKVQAGQARTERRARRARERGQALIPGRLLKVVTAIPGVTRIAAKSNAYGPQPPKLDMALLQPPSLIRDLGGQGTT